MGNPPFEDVSPIKNGVFPIAMLVYQRVYGEHLFLSFHLFPGLHPLLFVSSHLNDRQFSDFGGIFFEAVLSP